MPVKWCDVYWDSYRIPGNLWWNVIDTDIWQGPINISLARTQIKKNYLWLPQNFGSISKFKTLHRDNYFVSVA